MEYPKLRSRPLSTKTCTQFRGLDRRPGASERSYNNVWQWYWADEMNLSADRCPLLSVRQARTVHESIDGNEIDEWVYAMCGGEQLVILDATGYLWCGGNKVYIAGYDGVTSYYRSNPETGIMLGGLLPIRLSPAYGWSSTPGNNDVWSVLGTDQSTATLKFDETHTPAWYWVEGDQWIDLATMGVTTSRDPVAGDWLTVDIWKQPDGVGPNPRIVRMGAYAIIYPAGIWVNVVALEAGNTMVQGTNWGYCSGRAYSGAGTLTLTMCDEEGIPFNGVTVSSSEPATQSGYWLDTSNSEKSELKEWNVTYSAWVSVVSTFVKITTLNHDPNYDTLAKGDGISLYTECDNGTADEVKNLLNMDHYLYGADIPQNGTGWILVAGIIPSDTVSVTIDGCSATRYQPTFDFVVEAQNRLWGCRYSEEDGINEIYASKLGDFKNWSVYQGLATDSWTASRGIPAPFTGAISFSGSPLFFREESMEKIFPSSTGAHQIMTYHLEGVQSGSADSMVIIEERLFYKSPQGVCVYTGSLPYRISDGFGDWTFYGASAARHGRKYCVSMMNTRERPVLATGGPRVCAVYDLATGDWHMEDEAWAAMAVTWHDKLYYVQDGTIKGFGSGGSNGIEWYAESSPMSLQLPEHKWITYLRLRFRLELEAACRVYISYDDGPWERKGELHGNRIVSRELGIWPRRCDHFRIRLEGMGGCELQSVSYRMERSEQGH